MLMLVILVICMIFLFLIIDFWNFERACEMGDLADAVSGVKDGFAALTARVNAHEAALASTVAQLNATVAQLNTVIANLQASASAPTAEVTQAVADLKALSAQVGGFDPDAVVAPAPAVVPAP